MALLPRDPIKASAAEHLDRTLVLEKQFYAFLDGKIKTGLDYLEPSSLNKSLYLDLYQSQVRCRHLDLVARQLKQQGKGFYTIASSGHEANAAVALAFRPTDMAFLHYRSAAFMLQRAKSQPDIDMVRDILLSLLASTEDPVSAGRHKVLGSLALQVPPQTSTIASHLPKAVGCAVSIKRAATLKIESVLPADSVVLCSFGDASFNHAVAQSALNTARWITHKNLPLPLVFICEDNGLGISVPTPHDWIESTVSQWSNMTYIKANGLSLDAVYRACQQANDRARIQQKPVFLHLKTVRLLGHAGNDFELGYRSLHQIERGELQDPLLFSAGVIQACGWLTAQELREHYNDIKASVEKKLKTALNTSGWDTAEGIMHSIVPPSRSQSVPACATQEQRSSVLLSVQSKWNQPLTLGQQLNLALHDILLQYPNTLIFGEDVGQKGGVYGITQGLQNTFGPARVFDTLLDETTILGQAIGHAHNGFIPLPEIQFLAYLHNAEDQIRAEAATLPFFSNGQYANPMVIRIASFGYQKGFGGHFHNDNSFAVLRDIPGLIIACPSHGADAAKLLRGCVELAYAQQRVVVFLEPIALYGQKDLHHAQDGAWMSHYPNPSEVIHWGEVGWYPAQQPNATVVITYGNGYFLTRKAERRLMEQHGTAISIMDLRWLAPLNTPVILETLTGAERVVIVDECRETGSLCEQLVKLIYQGLGAKIKIQCVTAKDSFIPLGLAANQVLLCVDDIVDAVLA